MITVKVKINAKDKLCGKCRFQDWNVCELFDKKLRSNLITTFMGEHDYEEFLRCKECLKNEI